jgi:hypothetical protein
MLGRASAPGEQVMVFVAILFPPSGAGPIHRVSAICNQHPVFTTPLARASKFSIHTITHPHNHGRTQLSKLPKGRTKS